MLESNRIEANNGLAHGAVASRPPGEGLRYPAGSHRNRRATSSWFFKLRNLRQAFTGDTRRQQAGAMYSQRKRMIDLEAIASDSGLEDPNEVCWSDTIVLLHERGVDLYWLLNFVRAVNDQLRSMEREYLEQERASLIVDNIPAPEPLPFAFNEEITPRFLVQNLIVPLTKVFAGRSMLGSRSNVAVAHPGSFRTRGTLRYFQALFHTCGAARSRICVDRHSLLQPAPSGVYRNRHEGGRGIDRRTSHPVDRHCAIRALVVLVGVVVRSHSERQGENSGARGHAV